MPSGGVDAVQMYGIIQCQDRNPIITFNAKLEYLHGELFNRQIKLSVTDPSTSPEHGRTIRLESRM